MKSSKTLNPTTNRQDWTTIHPYFAEKLGFSVDGNKTYQEVWEEVGLTYQDAREWVKSGMKIKSGNLRHHWYVKWLRNNQWISQHSAELEKQFREYGLCQECNQLNTDENWCHNCNAKRFQSEFKNWTSKNKNIDRFIQQQQLNARSESKLLEWIPYEKFTDIEYLAEGGFSKIYKARWKKENDNKAIVLKILKNSQEIDSSFLQEILLYNELAPNNEIDYNYGQSIFFPRCYGISQFPYTKDYIIVMQYMSRGSIRQKLNSHKASQRDYVILLWQLGGVIKGLEKVHKHGLVHKDFHSGNILSHRFNVTDTEPYPSCVISDFGLCRPANETNKEKIYGVLPYVAPEVLQGQPYTQAADVYSFGIVAYELLTGILPYHNLNHDYELALKISKGLRPHFLTKTLPLLKELITQCWDADPKKRPTATELNEMISDWFDCENVLIQKKFLLQYREFQKGLFLEFCQQSAHEESESEDEEDLWERFEEEFLESKLKFSGLSDKIFDTNHSQAIYTSRLLDFQNLPKPQNNPSWEWQTNTLLELQIKSAEIELEIIKQSLNTELQELITHFIQIKKLALKDNTEELENQAWDIEDKLEEQGLSREKIDELIRYCERIVELEQQPTDQEQLQANIEIPTNK